MHHLEHWWCGAGRWCLLHWGEDEWYLCKGLDQRSGRHAEHWYPLQVGQCQKSRGNNSVFAVLLPLTKSTSQNYHIFSIILKLTLWIWDCYFYGKWSSQELVAWFLFGKFWATKWCICKKKICFEIRGHAFLGGNQSWYVIKQNNYLWKFSCNYDVTFFLPQIFNPRM